MMMKPLTNLLFSTMILSLPLEARTWWNTEKTQSTEATFVSADDTTVTLKKGYKQIKVPINSLSDDDKEWIKAETERIASLEAAQLANKEEVKVSSDREATEFEKKLYSKLQVFKRSRYSSYKMEKAPEFYILYYSASW